MGSLNVQQSGTPPQDAISPNQRKRLLSLAYGYLGSLAEGEDVVQEALLRFVRTDYATIQNAEAWLTTVVTRLAIDRLRSAQHRREVYPGEWLPEPVFNVASAEQDAITRSRLSVGLLYLLEALEPDQRVVFVLREVFENSYHAIAAITGKSESACRQLMVRARSALQRANQVPPISMKLAEPIVARFIEALLQGDQKMLLGILAQDAVLVADGGGKVPSILNPVYGADRIVRFFLGIMRKQTGTFQILPRAVNSCPGLLTFRNGQLTSVSCLSIEGDAIRAIYSVNNPDKFAPAHISDCP